MSKEKGPPGYPGDEAIRKKFGELIRELRLEKGLSTEQVDAFIDERMQEDTHLLLGRAFSLVTRELRESKKMSRAELSEVSGLPLNLINKLERAKAHNLTLTQVVRIAMALDYGVGDFVEQVFKVEQRLKTK
jgi:transcriptional regulator with XRE-family HTH domain